MQVKKFQLAIFLVVLVIVTSVAYQNIPILRQKIAGVKTDSSSNMVEGLIVPHHLLAKELINNTINKIENKESYEFVVLIGPNHYYPDNNTFTTTTALQGQRNLATDEIQELLKRLPDILEDQELIQNEHSIMEILPFISESFPNAKVLPMSIATHFNEDTFNKVITGIYDVTTMRTIVVASVDFSHNTQQLEALQKNEESIKAIQNFDYQTIFAFKDDHLDSPLTIGMLLKLMELKSSTEFELWDSTHSSIITDNPTVQGTSYVIGVFR